MNRSIQVSLGSRNEGDELVVRVVLITNFLDSNNGDSLADDSAKAGLTLTITYGTPILRQRKMTSSMGSTSAFLASTRAVTRLRPYFAKDEFFSCPWIMELWCLYRECSRTVQLRHFQMIGENELLLLLETTYSGQLMNCIRSHLGWISLPLRYGSVIHTS